MVTNAKHPTRKRPPRQHRRGAALLMCLFMVFMVSSLVLNIVATETLQLATTRNSIEYEQSLYWANAGIHDACSSLMTDSTWRGTVTDGTVPPGSPLSGYSATAADDGLGNVTIVSTGYSGLGERTVQATVEL